MKTPTEQVMVVRRARLDWPWHDADFLKLWAAQSVSVLGTEVTVLALPLLAVLTFDASPLEMGLLAAAGQAPFFLFSLPAGLWVDRVRRRPILIATDLASALLLISLPAAAWLGSLQLAQLYLVAFGMGALAVLGEVAHYSYTPSLVGRARLVEGNSKFQISHSAAASAGPGLGGLLIQLISAPLAVLVDAASFLASALLVAFIERPEPPPESPVRTEPLAREVMTGLGLLLGHPLLRPIMLGGNIVTVFSSASIALYMLYATRELGLGPATIGVIFAIGGIAAISAAHLAPWAGRHFGVGPAIIGGWTVAALGGLLVPLATGPTAAVVAVLALARVLDGATGTVANIHQWSLRQAVTPDHLHGRVTASHRFLVYGAGALGALVGGAFGSTFGHRLALFVCALCTFLGPLWTVFSPLRDLREQAPEVAERGPS